MATKRSRGKSKKAKKTARKAATPAVARKRARRLPAKKKKAAVAKRTTKRKAPKKAAPKKPARKKPRTERVTVHRREHGGHIEHRYGADLLRLGRSGDADPPDGGFLRGHRSGDDLAEELGEEAVAEATSGEHEGEDVFDQEVPEEHGGPFVVSTAGTEFASGTDPSNPKGSKREPFPTT